MTTDISVAIKCQILFYGGSEIISGLVFVKTYVVLLVQNLLGEAFLMRPQNIFTFRGGIRNYPNTFTGAL